MAIYKLKEPHERKLVGAMRTRELLVGQFAKALWNRDKVERNLQAVNESRNHDEGRLAMALKQIKDLQDRFVSLHHLCSKQDYTKFCETDLKAMFLYTILEE